jgi:hypothetical protein
MNGSAKQNVGLATIHGDGNEVIDTLPREQGTPQAGLARGDGKRCACSGV